MEKILFLRESITLSITVQPTVSNRYIDFQLNLLSPSLFSLHGKGRGIEKMTSLTTILNSTGVMKERDQHDWMDFIIETSGAADALDKAKVGGLEKSVINVVNQYSTIFNDFGDHLSEK